MALPEDRVIPEEKFPEKLRALIGRDAPKSAQLMVARGALPMPPVVQIAALYQLSRIGDDELKTEAQGTLRRLPPGVVRQVAAEPMLPVVLDWLAVVFQDVGDVLETLVQNRATDDETVVLLARTANDALCEAIARNQARLVRTPGIIEALYYNRNCRASTADRIVDFAARSGVDLSHLPGFDEVLAAVRGEGYVPQDAVAAAAADEAVAALHAETERIVATTQIDFEDDERVDEVIEEKRESLISRVSKLNVAQKVRLAMLGNQMERALLMREPNKLVQRAVIRSPGVTDNEAIGYAKNRGLPEEIVSFIAGNRQWTRHYQMKLSLVKNPKCPLHFAMSFMKMLRTNDLRLLVRDKNVSPTISKMAKNMLAGAK
ncbi:hypothetical protein L6V77_19995 [Myxococcota bacterium]|nr:hypothetical protein [Myxococcota bacterium]